MIFTLIIKHEKSVTEKQSYTKHLITKIEKGIQEHFTKKLLEPEGILVVLLQGPVIIRQDFPRFGGHKAIRGILPFPGQLPHPGPRDEVEFVVPVTGQQHRTRRG